MGIAFIAGMGVLLGLLVPQRNKNSNLSVEWQTFSGVIGWWYFFAWAVSFLPQLYLNFTRKSVIGQSFMYVFLNVLGFLSYSIYNVCFYSVASVQEDYKVRWGNNNNVQANDVAFAVYSLVCVIINTVQIIVYDRGDQAIPKLVLLVIGIVVLLFVIWAVIIAAGVYTPSFFNMLDWLYGLSMVKLVVSIVKYLPQIYLNWKRKLTVGWNIWNVLLDFTGGLLSVVQELMDSAQWSQIAGNPIKFALGSFSMIYDIVFMIQHYCLYKANNDALHARERDERLWGGTTQQANDAAAEGGAAGHTQFPPSFQGDTRGSGLAASSLHTRSDPSGGVERVDPEV